MKMHLPAGAWIGNINSLLKSLDVSDENVLNITSHEKWVSLHPVVLCMIVSLGLKLKDKDNLHFNKMEAKSKHYLERMGVFKLLNLNSEMKIKEHEESGRFIPVTVIKSSQQLSDFIKNMIPLLHKNAEESRAIEYVISELVRNVLEHSSSKEGAIVCAQYYKSCNKIRIGVVDSGIGIKQSLRNYHPKDDMKALALALQPGITGTTKRIGGTEQNAGAGLFFIKSLVKLSRDFFMIYSGKAMYKLLKTPKDQGVKFLSDPLKDHYSNETNLSNWPGTVVAIDLCLDEDIDFNNFLDKINQVYSKTRRLLNKKRYKGPKFI